MYELASYFYKRHANILFNIVIFEHKFCLKIIYLPSYISY